MISFEHKFIYIHIPKVAGVSIRTALENNGCPDDAKSNDQLCLEFHKKFTPPPPHWTPQHYVEYKLISQQQLDEYFKFSFVRNPWDRLVSEYKYRRLPCKYSFKDYLFRHFPKPGWSDEYCHTIPQYNFLFDQHGKQTVNFVGRYENLQNDFNKLCDLLSLHQKELPHINRSANTVRREKDIIEYIRIVYSLICTKKKHNIFKHYTQYYDDESKAFVDNLYRNDIETFNYKFGDN